MASTTPSPASSLATNLPSGPIKNAFGTSPASYSSKIDRGAFNKLQPLYSVGHEARRPGAHLVLVARNEIPTAKPAVRLFDERAIKFVPVAEKSRVNLNVDCGPFAVFGRDGRHDHRCVVKHEGHAPNVGLEFLELAAGQESQRFAFTNSVPDGECLVDWHGNYLGVLQAVRRPQDDPAGGIRNRVRLTVN
jgi:hypothetical protein